MHITDTRMTNSKTSQGRRDWMKQAITGGVAAAPTGFVPREATARLASIEKADHEP